MADKGSSWKLRLDKKLVKEFHDEAARGLALAGEHVLGEAKRRVPIEEHILEESGTTSMDRDDLKVAVVFDTPYAVYQHEVLDHKHDAGREAKYLENAINAEIGTVRTIIAQTIKGEL
jgi:hypothetical protein